MIILFYNKIDSEYWYFRNEDFPPGYYLTTDRTLLNVADVVVFYLPTLTTDYTLIKRPGQLWVGWSTESEKHYPQYTEPSIAHLFDLKMGYRQSDDVFTPYLYPRYRSFLRSSITPKIGGITMFVSSLFNQSRRLEYIQSLHKHFPIDSFGRVMKNKSLIRDYGIATKRETIAQYYFTIAFENSITEDYVTEKFYEPLLMGSVPIYMGAPNVDIFAPGDHCFINVRDFDNPKHLSEYLHYLIATPDEYQSYFHWKELPYKASFEELLDRISSPVVIRLIDAINRFIQ